MEQSNQKTVFGYCKSNIFRYLLIPWMLLALVYFYSYPMFRNWNDLFHLTNKSSSSAEADFANQPKNICHLPKLEPFSPQILPLINYTIFRTNYSCADDPGLGIYKGEAFHVKNGNILVRDVEIPKDVKCCFQNVSRDYDDENVRIQKDCHQIDNETTKIASPTEIVLVTCENLKKNFYYIDAFPIIHEKRKNVEIQTGDESLNVIIIGMDTTSQMQFARAMPQSKEYLDKNLSAIRFMGYNKVGDNTFPNLAPLLTGMSREEFTKACVKRFGPLKNQLHNCPFIWNNFASQGYLTSFAEDYIQIAIFNWYYYDAFGVKPPTDYYWRPYSILMERILKFEGHCYGPRLSFEFLLNNVKALADMFKHHRRYFNFVWSTKLGHMTLNTLSWGDQPLLKTLKYLHKGGHLNRTVLFLLGDHGYRNHDDVEQAMIENRQPLAYIVLPPWFQQRYKKAYENLRWNAENSVASHFDMYKTLLDILDLERFHSDQGRGKWRENRHFQPQNEVMKKRGQSLFEISPNGRNCESAGIPYLWCLCYKRIHLQNNSDLAVKAAQAAISAVNWEIKKFPECEKLRLGKILEADVLLVNEETWKKPECVKLLSNERATTKISKHSNIKSINSNRLKRFECKDLIMIQVRLVGIPHDPIYKTVTVREIGGKFSAPHTLVRDDWYSSKGYCVKNKFRPYCICKNFKNNSSLVKSV